MDDNEVLRLFRRMGAEARRIVRECSEPMRPAGKNPQGDSSLQLDLELENMVKGMIGGARLITEERPEKGGRGDVFVLDPLDGSKNFARGIPVYCFSIGAAPEGAKDVRDIRVSYVMDLVNGDEYHAISGKGAFLNGKRMECKPVKGIKIISFDSGDEYDVASKLFSRIMSLGWMRNFGVSIMSMCMLARGSLDAFVDVRNNILVTHAPALLIAKESGAIVTGAKGENISTPLKNGATFSVVAANDAALHRDILRIIKEQSGMV